MVESGPRRPVSPFSHKSAPRQWDMRHIGDVEYATYTRNLGAIPRWTALPSRTSPIGFREVGDAEIRKRRYSADSLRIEFQRGPHTLTSARRVRASISCIRMARRRGGCGEIHRASPTPNPRPGTTIRPHPDPRIVGARQIQTPRQMGKAAARCAIFDLYYGHIPTNRLKWPNFGPPSVAR